MFVCVCALVCVRASDVNINNNFSLLIRWFCCRPGACMYRYRYNGADRERRTEFDSERARERTSAFRLEHIERSEVVSVRERTRTSIVMYLLVCWPVNSRRKMRVNRNGARMGEENKWMRKWERCTNFYYYSFFSFSGLFLLCLVYCWCCSCAARVCVNGLALASRLLLVTATAAAAAAHCLPHWLIAQWMNECCVSVLRNTDTYRKRTSPWQLSVCRYTYIRSNDNRIQTNNVLLLFSVFTRSLARARSPSLAHAQTIVWEVHSQL